MLTLRTGDSDQWTIRGRGRAGTGEGGAEWKAKEAKGKR